MKRIVLLKIACLVFFMAYFASGFFVPQATADQRNDYLREAVKEQADKANVIMEQAISLQKQGQFAESIKLLNTASEMVPYDPNPYIFLIQTYAVLGQKDMALLTFERAGDYYTDSNRIYEQLGFLEEHLDFSLPDDFKHQGIFIAPFKDNKSSAVSFIFDDGPLSVYEQALPVFDQFGFKATIPVNPAIIPEEDKINPWWATWAQWQDAYSRGYEIANHSMNHVLLTALDDETLDKEINGSAEIIKEKIGIAPVSFIFPYDKKDTRVIAKAAERHLFIRDYHFLSYLYPNSVIIKYGGPYFSVKTANDIIDFSRRNHFWQISQCHAIETSADIKTHKPLSKEFLESHLKYIKDKGDIWVDTFSNVGFYLRQRKLSELIIHEQKKNRVVFSVKHLDSEPVLPMLLTIVVPVSDEFAGIAKAYREDEKKTRIPVRRRDSSLLLDVLPDGVPIVLEWGKNE